MVAQVIEDQLLVQLGVMVAEATVVLLALLQAYSLAQRTQVVEAVVLDDAGHLKAMQREDGASMFRYDVALGKAWGAVAMSCSSRKLAERRGERHDSGGLTREPDRGAERVDHLHDVITGMRMPDEAATAAPPAFEPLPHAGAADLAAVRAKFKGQNSEG